MLLKAKKYLLGSETVLFCLGPGVCFTRSMTGEEWRNWNGAKVNYTAPTSLHLFWTRDQYWFLCFLFPTAFMGTFTPCHLLSLCLSTSLKSFAATVLLCPSSVSTLWAHDIKVVQDEDSFADVDYLGFDGLSRGWILGTRDRIHLWTHEL